jgi:hypothetical protein
MEKLTKRLMTTKPTVCIFDQSKTIHNIKADNKIKTVIIENLITIIHHPLLIRPPELPLAA